MARTLHTLIAVGSLFVFATTSAIAAETLCSDKPEQLVKHEGIYAQKRLVDSVTAARRWDAGSNQPGLLIPELRVTAEGAVQVSLGFRETGTLGIQVHHGCLVFDGTQVQLQHDQLPQRGPFVRLEGSASSAETDTPYFNLLFKGCFVDQSKQRWCFKPNSVEVAGVAKHASLERNSMWLPGGGSSLKVDGEKNLWLFAPRADGGWDVHPTTWVSSPDYREPYWKKPWKVLTPVK
jgi:hypothetical protein